MTKSPTACLNEVLLRAALRFERANLEKVLDTENQALAMRNDNYASVYRQMNRVPSISQESITNDRGRAGTGAQ